MFSKICMGWVRFTTQSIFTSTLLGSDYYKLNPADVRETVNGKNRPLLQMEQLIKPSHN